MWFYLLVIAPLCAFMAAGIYTNKGRPWLTAFVIGLIFGPLGVILALLSSTDKTAVEQRALAGGSMQQCPHCSEIIRADANVCRYCQRDLVVP